MLLVALIAMLTLFVARAAKHQRVAVRVPARINQPRMRRR
jgi:hypothetical protein